MGLFQTDTARIVPKTDRDLPSEQRTVYIVKRMTQKEFQHHTQQSAAIDNVDDSSSSTKRERAAKQMGEYVMQTVKKFWVGCDAPLDVDGNSYKFQGTQENGATDEDMEMIPSDDVMELFQIIGIRNRPTVEQLGK